ncbi:glycine cleavage system protein GcvH [Candidatus Aerophobetes bacterium]|nr:glycine cleavage system protein GcvH [Candidatus Aerophobetes bacterium]
MYPKNLKYTETHEWIKVDKNIGAIGITDFAVEELTDIVYVELPSIGEKVAKGTSFGTIESVKAVSDLNSPVSGQILEVNTELSKKPEMVTQDPYGKGWMIKVKIEDLTDLDTLMDVENYKEWVKKEEEH